MKHSGKQISSALNKSKSSATPDLSFAGHSQFKDSMPSSSLYDRISQCGDSSHSRRNTARSQNVIGVKEEESLDLGFVVTGGFRREAKLCLLFMIFRGAAGSEGTALPEQKTVWSNIAMRRAWKTTANRMGIDLGGAVDLTPEEACEVIFTSFF